LLFGRAVLTDESSMKIAEIMRADVEVCAVGDNLAAAATRMWDADIGCLPVVDEAGHAIGMVTDRDVCMAALTRGEPLHNIPVAVAMSREVRACPPDATLAEAEEIMRSGQVRRLPVIDAEGSLVGIVSLADLARLAAPQNGGTGANGRKKRDLSGQEVAGTLAAICAHRGDAEMREPAPVPPKRAPRRSAPRRRATKPPARRARRR
jgi:CBS domain-containing protein